MGFEGYNGEKSLGEIKGSLRGNTEALFDQLKTNEEKRKFQTLLYFLFGKNDENGLVTAGRQSTTFEQNVLQGFFNKGIYNGRTKEYGAIFAGFKDICDKIWDLNDDKNFSELIDIISKNAIWTNNDIWVNKLADVNKEETKRQLISFFLTGKILKVDNKGVDKMENENKIEKIISSAIEINKQVIFTGAPGTGKTWSVREYVINHCAILNDNGEKKYESITDENGNAKAKLVIDEKQYKFVQFHPSYDYSDFVEGLRPVVIKGKEEPTFVRMDGVFKEFCRHIVEENDENKNYYFIVDEINRADLAKVFGELMFGLEESYRGKDNLIQTQYKNLITYKIIGMEDVDYLDYQNIMKDDIGKAIPIEDDVFKDGFYIPENLYFIGTMNDIDRSVDSMDFALRRRFQWIDVKANEIMKSSLHSILDKDNSDTDSDKYKRINKLAERVIQMNSIISDNDNRFGLSEAYHIGPAYFKKVDINSDDKLKASLQLTFETNITSILKEYTRGRKSEDINAWIEMCCKALLGED